MRSRLLRGGLAAALLAALLSTGSPAAALDGCADAAHPGGEWRSYGYDMQNSRTQPDETVIDAARAAELEVKFVLHSVGLEGAGEFMSTPVVADGCMYAATTGGWIFAFNADTGELVWKREMDAEPGGYGGRIVGGLTASAGRIIAHINRDSSPYVAALDQGTGDVIWTTVMDTNVNAYVNSSPVVFDGKIFSGFAGLESSPRARGGYVVLDEVTGDVLVKRYTIDDDAYAAGFGGGSIWSTAAVDVDNLYAYVGGGNPASKRLEHEYTNALLKIDVDPSRETFGDIVASYKGNVDEYFPGLSDQPACQYFGEHPDLQILGVWSAACLQLDLDFGASPNLFVDTQGRLVVGALQKSGVYHAAYAATMDQAWTALVGTPCFACNAGSSAFDGTQVVGVAVVPGQMYALQPDSGFVNWVAPVPDGLHFQSTSVANGVAYTVDTKGYFNAVDTSTGLVVASRSITNDAGGSGGLGSSGVAIARNTIYAPSGEYIVAYN